MIDLEQWQYAYLAGLVDGEGSVECQKETKHKGGATPRYSVRLSFCFATSEPLETISKWIGVPVKFRASRDAIRSATYRMHIPKHIALPLLRSMLPFLILKPEAARAVLALEQIRAAHSPDRRTTFGASRRMPPAAIEQMDEMFVRLRKTKSNKRPISLRI